MYLSFHLCCLLKYALFIQDIQPDEIDFLEQIYLKYSGNDGYADFNNLYNMLDEAKRHGKHPFFP